ncbi:MAG: hypothetical protein RIQ47_1802 [Bacteroidota bacterium]|jgi:tRNA pseudouridine55 synthase
MGEVHDPGADLSTGRVILVDKPLRWTSFDAVHRIKRILLNDVLKDIDDPVQRKTLKRKLKVGHAGTLDPLATGLLIICTGPMTKKIMDIQSQEKEYTGTITLGAVTPTYDLESTPEQFRSIEGISSEDVERTAKKFVGIIQQFPPIHSAVKVEGQRAYELAREGKEVAVKVREIEIKSLNIINIRFPEIDFLVTCSKGTYIRSLANDFGRELGCGGYLSALRRTRVGAFRVEDAVEPSAFLS